MRTTVVTLQFGSRAYFDVSLMALKRYTSTHDYGLKVAGDGTLLSGADRRWLKVTAILEETLRSNLVLYMDADSMIVDPSRPVRDLEPLLGDRDVLVGEDFPGYANTGVMLFRAEASDIVREWEAMPVSRPETANTWPLDEMAFNKYVRHAHGQRISIPKRVPGADSDFLYGSFVHHYPNGTEDRKKARLDDLYARWPG